MAQKLVPGFKMKVLVVSQYFMPETFIINELVEEMEKLGHEVAVLTGKPNYPDGAIFKGYQVSGVQTEKFGKDIDIYRVPLRPRGRGGAKNLALNYLSFAFFASVLGPWILRKRKFDVIFVFAPSPITATIPAIVLKFFKRSTLALWVLDLWPESLVVTKFVKNRIILKAVEVMVRIIYRCCDLILAQSERFIAPIKSLAGGTEVLYYPNSFKRVANREMLALPDEAEKVLRENFCVVFAGNIGKAQSVETIVDAAKYLKDIKDLKLVLVGSGSMLSWVQDMKKEHRLDNLECLGRFDISYIPTIYAKSKVLMLTLNSDEILQYTLPWKTQSYMAAGKPIVGAIDGEGARIILESQCGLVGPAEDGKTLAENIRQMHAMAPEKLQAMGTSGFNYFEKNFEMVAQVKRLLGIFSERAK
ncbi:glycosyltransferase family 4 protein [Bdellovibrio sp. 22V]|uniref:glycosyltransferase family 4 protein n=1 Tax=Bdellovibrio sp. 22V TaxID=3044166 RepID=UPI002542FD54|nr:glycosyltransferase family 4 protein [Bdellovibrio sp. 22V]WII71815.1 glycosyltransferase family 4 protein [Bdellovibrio sp. 22V]